MGEKLPIPQAVKLRTEGLRTPPPTLPKEASGIVLASQPDGGAEVVRRINKEFNPLDKIVPGINF